MKAQLFYRARPGLTLSFDLDSEESVLGRDPDIAVSLPTNAVSRQHARVRREGTSHWIENLKSANGTFLNGTPVQSEKLRHLDVVSLGKTIDLIFVLRDEGFAPVERDGISAARLVPLSGDAAAYEIAVGEMTIGRSVANNVVSDSGAVSKRHVRLRRSADQLGLEDLGSANGTFVNGVRCSNTLLRHGDEISLGGVDNYRIEIELRLVTSRSGMVDLNVLMQAMSDEERPQLSGRWKARYEGSDDEQAQIDAVNLLSSFKEAAPKTGGGDESTDKVKAAKRVATGKQPSPGGAVEPDVARGRRPPEPPSPAASASGSPAARAQASPAPQPAPTTPQASAASPRTEPSPLDTAATVYATAPSGTIAELRLTNDRFDVAVSVAGEHQLGRSEQAVLRIRDATVSRRHAIVIISDDGGIHLTGVN